MSEDRPALENLRLRIKQIWDAGDFEQIAKAYEEDAKRFVARRKFMVGAQVLDVACGSGNLACFAAQFGANAVGIDISEKSVEAARKRAIEASLNIEFVEGDAEAMPFADASFDVVLHMFGAVFPRPQQVANEMLRVCRPKGKIVIASYTDRGFTAEMLALRARYQSTSMDLESPLLWANEDVLRQRFRNSFTHIHVTKFSGKLDFPCSISQAVDLYCRSYGPLQRLLSALKPALQEDLKCNILNIFNKYNISRRDRTSIKTEYTEATIVLI